MRPRGPGSLRQDSMAIACGYRKNNEAASIGGLTAERERCQRYRAACSTVFIAHSWVQTSLNTMMPSWALCVVRQMRPTAESRLLTLVEFMAHSWVQTSLNSTAPVSRYTLVRHVVVAAVAAVETGATVAAPASCVGW